MSHIPLFLKFVVDLGLGARQSEKAIARKAFVAILRV
jgi:hypothetical protein